MLHRQEQLSRRSAQRRRFLAELSATSVLGLSSWSAWANTDFPTHPLRVIVPWAPGGLVDTGGRVVGDALTRAFGVGAPVENVPGAAGTIGADQVAKSAPDGYTLLLGTSSIAIDVGGGRKMPFDPVKDLTPVAMVADTYSVVVVPQKSPIQTLEQLIQAAKAKPGGLAYGTPGIGSPSHLFTELFAQTAGLQVLHVPYGKTPAINDLLGGRLSFMFSTVPSALPQIRNKQLRALAVTGSRRIDTLPDVPTVAEAGVPGYEASQWLGVFVPTGTPKDVVNKLASTITDAIKSPATSQTLAQRGLEPHTEGPAEFSKQFTADIAKWSRVIKSGNIRLE